MAWGPVALPAEHGGWGLMAEPVVLGLALAPSPGGVCLALAAAAAFLARHPLRLALLDRRKHLRYPRTVLAERFVLAYALTAILLLAAGFALARQPFWPALAVAAPFAVMVLVSDALGRSRGALPQVAGAVAFAAAAGVIVLAGGRPAGLAFAASVLVALRALTSVLYVRARLRLDRGIPAGSSAALVAHLAALAVAVLLALGGTGPWLGSLAFAVLLARAVRGFSKTRRSLRPQRLGVEELGYGLLTLVLLVTGYLAGA